MINKKGKEKEISPALVVAASLDCGGESVGVGGFGLCLSAETSISMWMVHSNLMEKNIKFISHESDM